MSRPAPRVVVAVACGLAAAVLGGALAIGAVHVTSLLVLSSLVAVLFGATLWFGLWNGYLPAPSWLAAGLATFSLVQIVPLPRVVLGLLAPANVETWSGAYAVLGKAVPGWLPISLDPGATLLESVKWFTYALAFAVAAGIARCRNAQVGALVVFGSGVVVAMTTLLHRLAGAEQVFGLYAPVGEFSRASLGPLLNANNLAGYLNLGVFCGIGLLLSPEPVVPRWATGLGVALLMGVALETGSRGGMVSLVLGMVVLGLALARSRHQLWGSRFQKRHALFVTASVGAFGIVLAVLAASPRLLSNAADKSLSKLAMAGWVRPLIEDYPWLGVGRGAFESAFQSYRIGRNNLIYSHPENLVVQWVAEWGVVVGASALVAFAWYLRPRALGATRQPVALGVICGLLVLFLQNLVDLGLEIPAVALAAVVAAGACYGGLAAERRAVPSRSPRARGLSWALLALALAVLVSAVSTRPQPVEATRRDLDQHLDQTALKDTRAVERLRSELHDAILRHPADPYFPRIGALVAFRSGDQSPMPWLDRSLTLGLTSGRTHYLLALVLEAWRRREQALLELRFAVLYDPSLGPQVARVALRLSREVAALSRVAPSGDAGPGLLLAMAKQAEGEKDDALRLGLMREAVKRGPERRDTRRALGGMLYQLLGRTDGVGPCAGAERAACFTEAMDQARAIERLAPDDFSGPELHGQLLVLAGDPAGAEQMLRERCAKVTTRRACLILRLSAAAETREQPRIADAAKSAAASGCDTSDDCSRLFTQIADVLALRGQLHFALGYYKRATEQEASDSLLQKLAETAERANEPSTAVEALTRLERKRRDPKLRRRIETLRLKALLPSVPVPSSSK